MEPKFRTIKTTNNTIKAKLMSINGIDKLIRMLGYQFDGEIYSLSDDNIARLLNGAPIIEEHRRLIEAKLTSPE